MDALVWHGGSNLSIDRLAPPSPADGEVIFNVALTGICGSDLHAYRGHGGARVPPLVLGHEAVGHVAGDETLYALFPLHGCGRCAACARGAENVCAQRKLVGLDRQGTFAQQVAVPRADLVPVPAGVPAVAAALTEPLATAVGTLDGLDLGPHSRIAVIGLGPIGLLSVYVALGTGAHVVAVDPAQARRGHALEIGVTEVFASVDELPDQSFDAVIDAVGVTPTWSAGVAALSGGGTLVIVGLGENSGPIDVGRLVRAGLTVRGTYAYTRPQFAAALQMLAQGPPALSWVESVPLTDAAAAFARLAEVRGDASKVLIEVAPA